LKEEDFQVKLNNASVFIRPLSLDDVYINYDENSNRYSYNPIMRHWDTKGYLKIKLQSRKLT